MPDPKSLNEIELEIKRAKQRKSDFVLKDDSTISPFQVKEKDLLPFNETDKLGDGEGNILGDGSDDLSVENLFTEDNINTKLNFTSVSGGNILFPNKLVAKLTDQKNDSLLKVNGQFSDLKKDLVYDLKDDSNINVDIKYYDESDGGAKTFSTTLSVIDFSTVEVQLSTSTPDTIILNVDDALDKGGGSTINYSPTEVRSPSGRVVDIMFANPTQGHVEEKILSGGYSFDVSPFGDVYFLTSDKMKNFLQYSWGPNVPNAYAFSSGVKYDTEGIGLEPATFKAINPDGSLAEPGELKTRVGPRSAKVVAITANSSGNVNRYFQTSFYTFPTSLYEPISGNNSLPLRYTGFLSAGQVTFIYAVSGGESSSARILSASKTFNVVLSTRDVPMYKKSVHEVYELIKDLPLSASNKSVTNFRILSTPSLADLNNMSFSGQWSDRFWGYAKRDILNFSGNSFANTTGSQNNNATLITPRHALAAEHYHGFPGTNPNGDSVKQSYQIGDLAFFYDHTTGKAISAKVIDTIRLDTYGGANSAANFYYGSHGFDFDENATNIQNDNILSDAQIIKFDRDLTAEGDIKVYKLGRFPGIDNTSYKYPCITMAGKSKYGDDNCVGIHAFSDLGVNMGFEVGARAQVNHHNVDTFGPYARCALPYNVTSKSTALAVENVSATLDGRFALSGYAGGDSGGPTYILYDSDLLLVSKTFVSSGAGPAYCHPAVATVLNTFIDRMGNTENYSVSTVELI